MSQQDFIAGLYGLLIRDSLGVPYEFHDSSSTPPPDQIEFEPPAVFCLSHPGALAYLAQRIRAHQPGGGHCAIWG